MTAFRLLLTLGEAGSSCSCADVYTTSDVTTRWRTTKIAGEFWFYSSSTINNYLEFFEEIYLQIQNRFLVLFWKICLIENIQIDARAPLPFKALCTPLLDLHSEGKKTFSHERKGEKRRKWDKRNPAKVGSVCLASQKK